MEFIFELFLELVIDGCYEASKSEKVPKAVRYLLAGIVLLLYIAVLALIFFAAIIVLKENLIAGILFLLLAVFLLVASVVKFRKTYVKNRKE